MSNPRRLENWEGKSFLITGPADTSKNDDENLQTMKNKLDHMKLKEWICCVERGETGYYHFHLTILTYKTTLAKTVRKWFPEMDVEGCHPEGGKDASWNYTAKDGKFITKAKPGQGFRTDLHNMKKQLDDGASTDDLWENNFLRMVMYHRSMKEYENVLKRKREVERDEDIDPQRFCFELEEYQTQKPLVIVGRSGRGKTEWALAQFRNPYLCSDIEDLRDHFNPSIHDGVVFDDMAFQHWPREAQIHLLDIKYTRTLHMRNINWQRPKNLRIIITGNKYPFTIDEAINRRVNLIDYDGYFYFPGEQDEDIHYIGCTAPQLCRDYSGEREIQYNHDE